MKTHLAILFWLSGLVVSSAQGWINFNNLHYCYRDGIERSIIIPGQGPVVDETWSAQLLELRDGQFEPVGAPQNFLGTWAPGVWVWANRSLSVPGGVDTTLAVQILDAHGQIAAISDRFAYTPPTSPTPFPWDTLMWNFRGLSGVQLVPEPSFWVLALLGFGVLIRRGGRVR